MGCTIGASSLVAGFFSLRYQVQVESGAHGQREITNQSVMLMPSSPSDGAFKNAWGITFAPSHLYIEWYVSKQCPKVHYTSTGLFKNSCCLLFPTCTGRTHQRAQSFLFLSRQIIKSTVLFPCILSGAIICCCPLYLTMSVSLHYTNKCIHPLITAVTIISVLMASVTLLVEVP